MILVQNIISILNYLTLNQASDMPSNAPEIKISEGIEDLNNSSASEKFKLLIKSQLQNSRPDTDPRQRRWSSELISICSSLYVRSPAAFEDLGKSALLILPSARLLQLYKNCIKQKPGLNGDNILWMQKKSERQNVSKFGLHGGLILNEMMIQDDLTITRQGDSWSLVGPGDMEKTNNNISLITHGRKKVELVTHSLQFMFHGFTGFRWPVAYFVSNSASAHQLFLNVWECIDSLDESYFTIDYLMLDGASANRSLSNMLLKDAPREEKFVAKDIYNSSDSCRKMYYL